MYLNLLVENLKEYKTFEEAYSNIKQFIGIVYKKKKLYSSIGYVPPEEFETDVSKTPELKLRACEGAVSDMSKTPH